MKAAMLGCCLVARIFEETNLKFRVYIISNINKIFKRIVIDKL